MSAFALLTPKDRAIRFYKACPEEFKGAIVPARLPDQTAFWKLASWNGTYPGPIGYGPTNTAKSRAVWCALRRLCIEDAKTFSWLTAKQLAEKYFTKHMEGRPEDFWEFFTRTDLGFIDDIDKLELNERNSGVLFEFYDWAYREHRPIIGTTNRSRAWWVDKMGEAHTRRMFDDAHFSVEFKLHASAAANMDAMNSRSPGSF
jgi:hypothetical protein